MTQMKAVANSLDPEVFPLKLNLSRSSGSNDGKKGKELKYVLHFYGVQPNLNQVNYLSAQTKITKGLVDKDMRHPMQKSVFGISNQVRFKPASSATETSYSIEILESARLGILLSRQ